MENLGKNLHLSVLKFLHNHYKYMVVFGRAREVSAPFLYINNLRFLVGGGYVFSRYRKKVLT